MRAGLVTGPAQNMSWFKKKGPQKNPMVYHVFFSARNGHLYRYFSSDTPIYKFDE